MNAWSAALAFALTGEELSLPESDAPDSPDVPGLVAALGASGWDAVRVHDHAVEVLAREEVWPHPIPDALRAGLGAAQLYAALGEARRALGVTVLEEKGPSTRTRLNADERRLMQDVPPHHILH